MSNRSIKKPVLDLLRIKLLIIDLFCGAGGFTEGAEQAVCAEGYRIAVVAGGVNHDPPAIESHIANHPETTHWIEDVRDKSLPRQILAVLKAAKKLYPNAKVLLHASLECTNFSNAKGGKPRDADSRSLAEYMPLYLETLKPDYFTVENVREFMSWGPLNDQGKPEDRKKGKDYVRWYQSIEAMGYRYDYRLHNTADFGASTSRTRYFACFARPGVPLVWPAQTHAKNPVAHDLFSPSLKKWKPIRDCLDLSDKGKSIFRNPPLSEKTYERIFEGLVRHVGNGDRSFLSKYFTGTGMNYGLDQPASTITAVDHNALITAEPFMARLFATASNNHGTYPASQPATTITTADGHAMVTPEPFAMTYNSGSPENRVKSLDEPAQTLLTENTIALVSSEPFVMQSNGGLPSAKSYSSGQPSRVLTTSDNQSTVFCMKYHSTGHNTFSQNEPCSTIPTNDSVGIVSAEEFVSLYYSQGKRDDSIQSPAAALTTIPKHRLVSLLFIDQQYGKSKPVSIDQPAPCITVNPHSALVEAFVADPQWGGHSHSLDQPGHTIIASQHKAPSSVVSPQYVMNTNFTNVGVTLDSPSNTITADRHWSYLVTAEGGYQPVILVYESDGEWVRKIKAFMAEYGIVDILMRMLKVQELKVIQGFPAGYVLKGSQTLQKKFIGNSVPPVYVRAWIEAKGKALANPKHAVA